MNLIIHPHAIERAEERGTTEEEIKDTVLHGEEFPAKNERSGFRRTIVFNDQWQGKHYYAKQIECYAVKENNDWVVISVVVKYF
jgi:hypothetical protein